MDTTTSTTKTLFPLHFYDMRDVIVKYPGLAEVHARIPNHIQQTVDNVCKSLAWAMHNEPILEAMEFWQAETGESPDMLWVFEDDVGWSGTDDILSSAWGKMIMPLESFGAGGSSQSRSQQLLSSITACGGDISELLKTYETDGSDLLASEYWPSWSAKNYWADAETDAFRARVSRRLVDRDRAGPESSPAVPLVPDVVDQQSPDHVVDQQQSPSSLGLFPSSRRKTVTADPRDSSKSKTVAGFQKPEPRFLELLRMATFTEHITGVMTKEHVHRFSSKFLTELKHWASRGQHAWSEVMTPTIGYLGVLEGRLKMKTFHGRHIGKKFHWDTMVSREEFEGYCSKDPKKLWHALKFS